MALRDANPIAGPNAYASHPRRRAPSWCRRESPRRADSNRAPMRAFATLETPWEKRFFFLPLGHSEELAHLETAVRLAEELVEQGPSGISRVLGHSASQARGHRDVIARFGCHPHRNALLGRRSTPEELVYLAGGQLVHTRPLPR
jgi:uncharacterized protein (DUF924 family)